MLFRTKMPNFAMIFLIVAVCVAGVITDDSVQLDQNENLQAQNPAGQNINRNELNIKHLIEPFAKRRNGFLPSRGKKQPSVHSAEQPETGAGYDTFADDDDSTGDDSERMQFIDQVMDKRGSSAGFMPMRGRKSNLTPLEQDFYTDALEQELDALNTIQKRRAQSFMPMRGRKFDHEFPRFYHRVMPFKPNTNVQSTSNSQLDGLAGFGQKRKGMGFFGARGKRSTI